MMSGKLFILTGKSSTGKDTLLNQLVTSGISIARLVPYTTRPTREGEEEGREYHFVESIKGIHGARCADLSHDGRGLELRGSGECG